jgi:hypothetical protein
MTVKVPSAANIAKSFGNRNLTSLVAPVLVGAHQTIAGWAMFELSNEIVGRSEIQAYTVLLTDSHNEVTRLANTFVREMTVVSNEAENENS